MCTCTLFPLRVFTSLSEPPCLCDMEATMLSTPAWLSAGGHQCFAAMGMVRTNRSRAFANWARIKHGVGRGG